MDNLPQLPGGAIAIVVVNNAPIALLLDGDNAPITAGNFADLVERRFYDGISFHRVVREPNPFVVQAGDPQSTIPGFPPSQLGSGGFIDPATGQQRFIPLEILPQGAETPVIGQTFAQAGITVPPELRNVRGSIAMARVQSDPNSASSQFFINLNNNTFLDGNFAAFGGVIGGLEVVDQIQQGDRIQAARIVSGVVPSRVSAAVTDVTDLNTFYNILNFASLPLGFALFTDADDNLTITPEFRAGAPVGAVLLGGNDVATGSVENDIIYSNQGNDTISGGAGFDLLRAGRDDDLVNGGDGSDILHGNKGNDTLNGDGGNDFLRGGQDNDMLIGGEGNDYLLGDFGEDLLVGGPGADAFIVRPATAVGAPDRAADFNPAEGDRLILAGEIAPTDLAYVPIGADTVVQQISTGAQLVVVTGVPGDVVQSATTIVSSLDLGVAIA